jgi:V/A-type H+-transporting ATPase subunit I
MLTEHGCWIPLQLGGAILIGYFILDWNISFPVFILAGILVIIGVIQLFISSGPIGFFDITGYVGDWLSYARLLALGLATAGMALAFNVVAALIPTLIPYIGIEIISFNIKFGYVARCCSMQVTVNHLTSIKNQISFGADFNIVKPGNCV